MTITAIFIVNTPIRNYLPGYLDAEIRREMIENALKTDSLERALKQQSGYINNITAIIRGDVIPDTVPRVDSIAHSSDLNLKASDFTEDFIRNYEEEQRFNLAEITSGQTLPENLIFYRPVNGIVSDRFNVHERHFGIDIATSPKESILATMKGVVIFAGFDANAGYVIQLQHANGFVSIYKHNAVLLKEQNDEVLAGEAIAMAGNTGNYSTGSHLHFELWYKGYPIDPEEFIIF
ncbi:M23 family metallopeptidase [Bacteroidales bacterium OttesenSCG-928-M11]|nr:M23 family metallopeptidase [Bacteroidales bacterium OttesenSCG-928-M11]